MNEFGKEMFLKKGELKREYNKHNRCEMFINCNKWQWVVSQSKSPELPVSIVWDFVTPCRPSGQGGSVWESWH